MGRFRKPIQAGATYHRLTFLSEAGVKWLERFGNFQCACGNQAELRVRHVINGLTKSCGCYKREHLRAFPRRKPSTGILSKTVTHGETTA